MTESNGDSTWRMGAAVLLHAGRACTARLRSRSFSYMLQTQFSNCINTVRAAAHLERRELVAGLAAQHHEVHVAGDEALVPDLAGRGRKKGGIGGDGGQGAGSRGAGR